jgi:hypothetical protein
VGADRERELRRVRRGDFDATTPVSVWLLLSAPVVQRAELFATVEAFCASRPNARLVRAEGTSGGRAFVYIVVDGGDVAGVVAGDDRAVAGLATVRAVVSRLFMFEPVLVPEPAGEQTA